MAIDVNLSPARTAPRAALARARTGAALVAALLLAACNNAREARLQGWVEGDLVFVGPDEPGRVETLAVREGDTVTADTPLFTVDSDLQKSEVAANEASVKNAQQAYDRAKMLVSRAAGTEKALDDAEANLLAAQARLNSALTHLARRRVLSSAAGTINQIYYRPGEMVPAGRPVLALLPPGNIKVRFFVPEAMLARIVLGNQVRIACDSCAPDPTARITFIARSAEFTPPVIYSQEERSKLVFMIEARTERTDQLRVGQPVTVTPLPQAEAAL